MSAEAPDPAALLGAAHTLAVDAAAAEAVRALDAAGVPSLLLKGPVVADLLDTPERRYGDADLLVGPAAIGRARDVLRALGYHELPEDPEIVSLHARPWRRDADGAVVDLHHTIWGSDLLPGDVWEELWRTRRTITIAGKELTVPGRAAATLTVALHAAQHGPDVPGLLADLRRAQHVVDVHGWRDAERLADRLGALRGLGIALTLAPEAGLLGALPLVRAQLTAAPGDGERLAIGLARLRSARGPRGRVAILARLVVPEPARLRAWSALARRGPPWSAVALLARVARLTWAVVRAALRVGR